uniref:(northern house mosquito) hypothetical protein n=1 Tax=Culex pipiens TaxID=7175 RepID=A0A8D8CA33_CULPI
MPALTPTLDQRLRAVGLTTPNSSCGLTWDVLVRRNSWKPVFALVFVSWATVARLAILVSAVIRMDAAGTRLTALGRGFNLRQQHRCMLRDDSHFLAVVRMDTTWTGSNLGFGFMCWI